MEIPVLDCQRFFQGRHGADQDPAGAFAEVLNENKRGAACSVTTLHRPKRQVSEGPQSQVEYIRQSKSRPRLFQGREQLYDLAMAYVEDAERAITRAGAAVWASGIWEAPLLLRLRPVPISLTNRPPGIVNSSYRRRQLSNSPRRAARWCGPCLGEWYLRPRCYHSARLVSPTTVANP